MDINKKVAVIGANSYIARNVILRLEERYPGLSIALYDFPPEHPDGRDNYKQVSILDKESLKGIDFDCDVIYLFAGRTGSYNGFDEYDSFLDVNERALLNILTEYRAQGSHAKIVFPSTRLVYKGAPGPLAEDAEKEFKTIYAMNKFACENYLKQYNNRWFLFGRVDGRDDITNLALDRIVSMTVASDVPFIPNDSTDFEHFFDDVVGVTVPHIEPMTIELQLSEKRFMYVVSKPLHHTQKTIDENNHIISIRVIPNRELDQQILSYGADMEVLAPDAYRCHIKKKIEENYKKYFPVQDGCTGDD